MFPTYDPTLYGATLPQRDFNFVNPFFAQWNQPFPIANYGQQFPLQYGQQLPQQYGQQFPLQYSQQFPQQYGQQIPWSFYPRVAQPFMQSEFVPPMLPFQAPIQGRNFNYFGQAPYLPFPQSQFNLPQFKMQLPFGY